MVGENLGYENSLGSHQRKGKGTKKGIKREAQRRGINYSFPIGKDRYEGGRERAESRGSHYLTTNLTLSPNPIFKGGSCTNKTFKVLGNGEDREEEEKRKVDMGGGVKVTRGLRVRHHNWRPAQKAIWHWTLLTSRYRKEKPTMESVISIGEKVERVVFGSQFKNKFSSLDI